MIIVLGKLSTGTSHLGQQIDDKRAEVSVTMYGYPLRCQQS